MIFTHTRISKVNGDIVPIYSYAARAPLLGRKVIQYRKTTAKRVHIPFIASTFAQYGTLRFVRYARNRLPETID